MDVATLPWVPLGPPGLHSRLLSRDPETGARTALQCMRPQEGYVAPPVAHFHRTYEELLVVHGRFTFDSVHWLQPRSYCFHRRKPCTASRARCRRSPGSCRVSGVIST